MMTKRVELREDVLTKVNGGFYYDPTRKVIGTSENSQLYKFVTDEDEQYMLNLMAIADFLGPLLGLEQREELGDGEEVIELFLKENRIVPYAA